MTESTLEQPLSVESLNKMLEPLIRRVIREELTRLVQGNTVTFSLEPSSEIYQDMKDILRKKKENSLQFFTGSEVWDD